MALLNPNLMGEVAELQNPANVRNQSCRVVNSF